MRIGVDAKWYFEGPPSGKRVVKNLVDEILKTDTTDEFVIFLNAKHKHLPFPDHRSNIILCYIWAGNNFLSNLFVVPFYSKHYRVGAVLYQNFISIFDRSNRIAYIHDVLFLSNPEYYTIYERLYFAPLKFLTRRSDLIVTVSQEEKERLLHYGFSDSRDKIIVAYHGVDDSFHPLKDYKESDVQKIKQTFLLPDSFLLYVGRLNLRKNIDNLLRAIPLIQHQTIPLVIVGADDWKKSNHAVIIKSLGIEDRVQFKGAIYKDLGIVYSMATIFCFPSYAESFGLPPLEAMACGVPVIVSNTTSLPEICGDAGNYITPDKPEEIAQAIDRLLNDMELYHKKISLGLEQAKKFTWYSSVSVILEGIRSITKKGV